MKPELFQRVVVNRDMPEEGLKKGDVAWLIDYLEQTADGEEGCVLEVFNALGESIHVVAVPVSTIEPLRADQVPAVRSLAQAS